MALSLTPASREFTYWMFRYRRVWRGTVVLSVVNPLLFLAAVGAVLGELVDRNGGGYLGGTPYLVFLVPGLMAAAAMQTGFQEAGPTVLMSVGQWGNYRSAVATSMRPGDVLAGHLMFVLFRIVTTMAVFAGVVAVFGVVGPARAALLIPPAVLTGLAFATPMAAWAVGGSRMEVISGFYRFVIMPLYMFSGTFFPIEQLPDWLRPVVYLSPLWHGVDLTRGVALGTATAAQVALHTGVLSAVVVAGVVVAARRYRRSLHR